jgi:hypothetical protein
MQTKIVWHAEKERRGIYNNTAQLNDMFDLYDCVHYGGLDGMPENIDGAVVVVHGGREIGHLNRLNSDIEPLKWVLLIFEGDEENSFPVESVQHPNKKIWVQEPLPGKHDFADRYIIDGYAHDQNRHIVKCDKDLDWVFAGQITHPRRRAFRDVLQTIPWGGIIVETKGYCQGVSREEYYRLMCRAKVVPCPSGPFSPDATRPWETLDCGGIPILDDLSPSRTQPGFWKYVLGDHPLPVTTDWNMLPMMIEELKRDWEATNRACQAWWRWYRKDFTSWLGDDLRELRG